MNELAVPIASEVAVFDPQKTKRTDAQADAIIDYAKRIKDWPLLERAVDEKIEQQREFVGWWRDLVTPNKARKSVSAERGAQTEMTEAESLTGITHQQVSRWAKRVEHEAEYRAALFGAAYKKAMGDRTIRHSAFEDQIEWYTPAQYIEAAREVLARIDLDPASSDAAQKTVKAEHFFTANDDGLKQAWVGRIWVNPPYSQPLIEQFVDKLIAELTGQNVRQAILLTHNSTDTGWFHRAAAMSPAICFTRGRVNFIRGDGFTASPPQGQAFFYFGDTPARFCEVFAKFGFIR
jgi:phage N-6-adenine-methyltransferase